ncbi:solute carrier family 49 member A3-like isoform X1 [Pecten maximus]|uniref:solute carrier family 49 member A3-like isoform X1 n=1 Tax=Pecten maximus TaxID=6579 RepID=UPI0014589E65|nr:solute carrier family 49 member A3-like isoform X1 [Pecten maximus]
MAPTGGGQSTTINERTVISSDFSSSSSTPSEYRTYKSRWFILVVVSILNLSNAMVWITFSPIADLTAVYYKINSFQVNILSLVFLIASIPFGLTASWILDTFGLRASLLTAAWLNGIGSLLRNFSTFDFIPDDSKFAVLLVGQILAACAQPFVMFAPTKLAALWFPENQRATANMLTSMANPLGILVTNVLIPAIVNGCNKQEIPIALWIVTGPALLVMLMTTFGVCSSVPPTPPSASADEASQPFVQGFKKMAKNKNYWILNFLFGAGLAIFTAFTSFLDQILCPRGYSNNFSGICGALMIAGGLFGAIISGIYVDKTKRFEEVVKVSYALAIVFAVGFMEVSRLRDQEALVAASICLFGMFGFALYPISLEMAVEITYPVAEATSSGLLVVSGQIQGIVMILVSQVLAQPLPATEKSYSSCVVGCGADDDNFTPQDWTDPIIFMLCYGTTAAVIGVIFLRGDYKRLKAEQKIMAGKILQNSMTVPT